MKTKMLLKELRKTIRKDFGEKCTDFVWGCYVCANYMALEILENSLVSHIVGSKPIHGPKIKLFVWNKKKENKLIHLTKKIRKSTEEEKKVGI